MQALVKPVRFQKGDFCPICRYLCSHNGHPFQKIRKSAKYLAKTEKITFFCFASSEARVGAPQEPICSSGARSVLLRSFGS